MTVKELQQCEEEWQAAEAALKAAQKLPGGPARIDALRKVGQMRYDADQRRRALQDDGPRAGATTEQTIRERRY